ncbi:MAG: iron-containing alcohol dehydrogenase [Cohaesibacter sp.]|jgi:alcohol dehydrogenase class IV|nr:iron-containing alcohol dehydrogenase [Cohaesibacter sp.]
MAAFSFNSTRSILCESGIVASLGERIATDFGTSIQIVTDKGLIAAGLVDPFCRSLEQAGVSYVIFDEVVADPPEHLVLKAQEQARASKVEAVVGLGGGSSLDVAKLSALLAKSDESLDDIYGVGMVKGERLPLVLIPTTAGTGSEVTPISIITVGEAEKKGVVSPVILPDLAVLDAELTLGLPAHVTAATGIDAMVHAIEAYTSASANNNPISRGLAQQALLLLGANIEAAVKDGSDRQVRSDMLLGSLLAGQAFANSPVAAVHALAYPIGGIFHVPHGLSNALVLPEVMRFNASACGDAYAELAPLIFPDCANLPQEERCGALIDGLEKLSADLGLETGLREVGIGQEDLPKLASEAMKQTRLLVNNPREVSEADALAIYQAAW